MSRELTATASQTAGPYFHIGLHPHTPNSGSAGVHLTITVTDVDGVGVEDALVELWKDGSFTRAQSNGQGRCEVDIPSPAEASPYVNVYVFARGLLRHLHTRIYFAAPSALAHDPLLLLVPAARRGTLIATPDSSRSDTWTFEMRLRGPAETVFFDA